VTGPYRILRHPLYIGNFVLVVGMLVALRPALWLGCAVLVGFIVEYTLIVVAEEECLSGFGGNPKCKLQNANCKMADGGQADGRTVLQLSEHGFNAEWRMQSAKCKTAAGEKREATGESFLLRRALVEWRTWVVTGVAFGLALLKAAIVS